MFSRDKRIRYPKNVCIEGMRKHGDNLLASNHNYLSSIILKINVSYEFYSYLEVVWIFYIYNIVWFGFRLHVTLQTI